MIRVVTIIVKGVGFIKPFENSAVASASRFIRVLASSLWSGQCFLTPSSMRWLTSAKWLRVCTQHLWLESLFLILPHLQTWLPSSVSVQCRCHTRCQTSHGESSEQCDSHGLRIVQRSPCILTSAAWRIVALSFGFSLTVLKLILVQQFWTIHEVDADEMCRLFNCTDSLSAVAASMHDECDRHKRTSNMCGFTYELTSWWPWLTCCTNHADTLCDTSTFPPYMLPSFAQQQWHPLHLLHILTGQDSL